MDEKNNSSAVVTAPLVAGHTPGPWSWRDAKGAGLQISATLPAGFQFDGTYHPADGKTSSMLWTVRDSCTVQIADERWVQFSTGSWSKMQEANARLIAAAPDLLAALKAILEALRIHAPGTTLNNHQFDQLGIDAYSAITAAEGK